MSFDSGRGPPNIEGMTSLKVDNLTYRTGIEDLKKLFGKFGEVGDIYIPRDRKHLQSRGFAFVRFWEKRDAEDAMDKMDRKVVDGREIRVQMARYGRPTETYKPSRRDNRGYGGGRYRSRSRSRSPRRRRSRYSRSRSRSPKRRYSRSRSPRGRRSRSYSPRRSRSPARPGRSVREEFGVLY
ncbi:serine/arginine-rich splicing factor 2-like isoform X3 [Actinia tenebrosa]|uniref:Serine/arginine-rich splicing factor 2-like isoform X3 n=1 Tax=Actinia tenebrosa TaxID=6105 RepID=A0A6P8I153_ACTTE|nr:serine/arginine-rich splicing factor 2-like isoform X3 [Actinia tenebrosa]